MNRIFAEIKAVMANKSADRREEGNLKGPFMIAGEFRLFLCPVVSSLNSQDSTDFNRRTGLSHFLPN